MKVSCVIDARGLHREFPAGAAFRRFEDKAHVAVLKDERARLLLECASRKVVSRRRKRIEGKLVEPGCSVEPQPSIEDDLLHGPRRHEVSGQSLPSVCAHARRSLRRNPLASAIPVVDAQLDSKVVMRRHGLLRQPFAFRPDGICKRGRLILVQRNLLVRNRLSLHSVRELKAKTAARSVAGNGGIHASAIYRPAT